ncbi:hypothetical protein TSAR_003003 [Trichomalopsis sarcophagae]|uniref:PI31 proteasome regulator N-terminal domain-containing protein n=1 Tax=Trichomalopsis sarcophagae TaxID=543379 RepID=A0A232EDD0_9HYME|nr:hypothetical protein TSAR_003003 [Trichomalopsis sarcophagae]
MSTPYFAEDSNALALAPILKNTVDRLSVNADKYDYIMAFFIALMAEGGYRVMCLYDKDTETWSTELTTIPPCWKSEGNSTYKVDFLQFKRTNVGIRLIAIAMGDWIVVNLMSKEDYINIKTRSIAVNVTKYVNMHNKELGKFWHLKDLAMKFKNNLLAPLHSEIMMVIGVASPSLIGIPDEIRQNICRMLDTKSRTNLEKSCSFKKTSAAETALRTDTL